MDERDEKKGAKEKLNLIQLYIERNSRTLYLILAVILCGGMALTFTIGSEKQIKKERLAYIVLCTWFSYIIIFMTIYYVAKAFFVK